MVSSKLKSDSATLRRSQAARFSLKCYTSKSTCVCVSTDWILFPFSSRNTVLGPSKIRPRLLPTCRPLVLEQNPEPSSSRLGPAQWPFEKSLCFWRNSTYKCKSQKRRFRQEAQPLIKPWSESVVSSTQLCSHLCVSAKSPVNLIKLYTPNFSSPLHNLYLQVWALDMFYGLKKICNVATDLDILSKVAFFALKNPTDFFLFGSSLILQFSVLIHISCRCFNVLCHD